jgi:hypothetical protein
MSRLYPHELRIAVGTIFHNKPEELKRMLYSMPQDAVQTWFLIGGAFADSKDPQRITNSKTLNVIDTFREEQEESGSNGIEVMWSDMPESNEFQKRMRYVDMCRQFDINCLFILDSDEYVYDNPKIDWYKFKTDVERFRRFCYSFLVRYPKHNVYSVEIIQSEFLGKDVYPRIWMNPSEVSYVRGSHFKFGNPETDDINDYFFMHQHSWGVIEGIILKHDHTLRSVDDMAHRQDYQEYLVRYELNLEEQGADVDTKAARLQALKEKQPWKDNCMCMRCVKVKGLDPETLFDPRPRDRRQENPYVTGVPL